MKIGTKSLLFGVHQFLWHPFVVGLAWRKLYRKWPNYSEWLAIFFHDWGYWGCPNIDGPEGRLHPERSATIAMRVTRRLGGDVNQIDDLVSGHSREYAKRYGIEVSKLCWPDKYSVVYEPRWFYLLRAKLSGELEEFRQNAIRSGHITVDKTGKQWFNNYRTRVNQNPNIQKLLHEKTLCPLSTCRCGSRRQ